jgi:FKBP-type peptidyl-prolyl cis-trans isomerase FkpA
MRRFPGATPPILVAVAVAFFALTALMPTAAPAQTAGKPMTTASGLQIIDSKVGTGAAPKPGQTCVMHYTGWLYEDGKKGKKFDSSVDRNEPFEFPIGQRKVIAGWDEGVASMKVGGKRTLIIPPALGYGARGAGRHSSKRDPDLRRRVAGREGLT